MKILILSVLISSSNSIANTLCTKFLEGATKNEINNSQTDFIFKNLEKANQFFSKLDSDNLHLSECFSVRTNINVEYNRETHFASTLAFNNSVTIPAGESWLYDIPAWPIEIWFRTPTKRHPETKAKLRVMDTAQSPSAIFHEYAHIAMQKYFPSLYHYQAVPEAYANYFAGSIQGEGEILGESVNSRAYKIKFTRLKSYHPDIDKPSKNPTAGPKYYFEQIPSLLWWMRQTATPEVMDIIAWRSLRYLNQNAKQIEVVEAIRSAILEEPVLVTKRQAQYLHGTIMSWKYGKPLVYPDDLDKKFEDAIEKLERATK